MASASALDSLNCAVSGASSGRGEGRKIKDALLARETVEQVDDFAGRVKAKRVECKKWAGDGAQYRFWRQTSLRRGEPGLLLIRNWRRILPECDRT